MTLIRKNNEYNELLNRLNTLRVRKKIEREIDEELEKNTKLSAENKLKMEISRLRKFHAGRRIVRAIKLYIEHIRKQYPIIKKSKSADEKKKGKKKKK